MLSPRQDIYTTNSGAYGKLQKKEQKACKVRKIGRRAHSGIMIVSLNGPIRSWI